MRSGDLDRRVTFQRATMATNDFGEEVPTWSDLVEVAAQKTDLPDGERWRAAEVQATVTTRFLVRWSTTLAGLTPKDRLVCDGRTYDIHHVKEVQRRTGLEITAAARAE